MELKEVIANRKSIRDYKDTPVPEDKLLRVLEAARLAQSGANRQEWKFVVVRDANKREVLCQAAGGQKHVGQAPVIIAAVSTAPESIMKCEVPSGPVNVSIAIDHMTLAAHEEGLGTCWIGAFSQDESRQILEIPDTCTVIALLTLGFPNQEGREKNRKTMEEIVCYDTYKE
ncbi:MAG: nitroreductase family protein [Dehalococcoidales bacterium]